MALAIDTKHMTERWMPNITTVLSGHKCLTLMNRFHLRKVSAYGTVLCDASILPVAEKYHQIQLDARAAFDWQADQDDDLDDVEIFHHLTQLAVITGSSVPKTPHAISLLATAHVPEVPARAGRQLPLSSFRQVSFKVSLLELKESRGRCGYGRTCFQSIINDHNLSVDWLELSGPNIIGTENLPNAAVFWCLQLDYVDLLSSRYPSQNLGKRRRRRLDPFIRLSPRQVAETSRDANYNSEAKIFRGVRYRPNRRTWVAEMKPPRWKNKVSLGDFKSQVQAARAVDVAFHYYGKTDLLNFPGTVALLPSAPEIVDDVGMLEFVKKEVKRLASIGFTLPSRHGVATGAASAPLEIVESSRRRIPTCTECHLHLRNSPSSSSVQCVTELNETVPNFRPEVEHFRDSQMYNLGTFPSPDVDHLISASFSDTFPLELIERSRSPSPSSDSQSGFISLWD